MALYETLKFIHIVAACVVLGGSLVLTFFGLAAVIGRKGEQLLAINSIGKWVGPRVFAPAWALVLAFGIWTTLEGGFSFGDAWITIGFVIFVISFVLGPGFYERTAKALDAAIQASGPASEAALAHGRRWFRVALLEVALLIFAVWAMTAKPGL